jgi:23S rRNA G2445 N2-methylase RlmL
MISMTHPPLDATGRDLSPTTFVARCLRGIEPVLAAEIRRRSATEGTITGHRTVEFRTPSLPEASALRLGCADDIFLKVGDVEGIDHTRAALARLGTAVASLSLDRALQTIARLRQTPMPNGFTVVASFLGKRNYNRFAVEDAVAGHVARSTGLSYESSQEGSASRPVVTFRIHLADDRGMFGLRVFDQPLHRRAYKTRSHEGSLHPPLAFAMAMLAGIRPTSSVLDPFCGAGTLLVEAASLQPSAALHGFDIDADRVAAAEENARNADAKVVFVTGDAARMPIDSRSVDRVITNPPWGIAVEAKGAMKANPELFFSELDRVMRDDARGVLVVHPESHGFVESTPGFEMRFRRKLSLFGQHPELCVFSKTGGPPEAFDVSAPFGRDLVETMLA